MNKGRKIIAILLSVCLVISTICADAFVARSEAAEGEKTLKVLSIGNSFSQDAQRWIYQVAVDAGYEDVIFANLYWGGCSLWQHWSNAKSDYAGYEYQKNTTGAIEYTNMVSIKTAVMDEDWDYITLQQVSGLSGQADTYNSDLTNLISYVKEYATNPNMKLGWHMTWAYQADSNHGDFAKYNKDQMTMYNAIINATKQHIVTNNNFDFIIPSGTTVQNLRTSFIGDTLTRDGYHMSYELGRYVTALTWVYKLFEMMGMGVPSNVTYTPDSWKVPVTYLPAIHESVSNAIKTPFSVTNSSYTTASSMLNTNDYVLLDWKPVCNGYWNSTDTNTYDVITTTAGNSKDFIASGVRFTRDDIPLGSVIVVQNGYQYRPEGWAKLGEKNPYTRPSNVQQSEIIVNEAWWGSFNYRGFNLSKQSGSISGTTAEQAGNILKIYVPKEKVNASNSIDSFKLMGKECVVGDNTVSLTVVEGTNVSNLVPSIKVSDGATITPSATTARDFSKPVHYKVKNKAGHTKIYTVSVLYKKAIDLSMYDVINWSPKLNSYWNSASPATQNLSSDSKYIASKLFSKSEIPVGSIIEIDAGYQYRPEAWKDMTSSTSGRPGVVAKAQVIVDEAWWGDYNYRAFNISSINGTSLTGNTDAAIAAFRIYVPKNLVEVFGVVVDSPADGMISVVWGNPGNNQLFNVYIDGKIAVSDSGTILRDVGCASYLIPTTEGTHTIKVTTTYGGIETSGVTNSITVVGNGITETTEEATTRKFNGCEKIEAEYFAYNQGVVIDTNSSASNGHNIGGVHDGDYIRYDNVSFDANVKGINICYSSPVDVASGYAQICINSIDNVVGVIELPNNGTQWANYSEIIAEFNEEITAGTYSVYVKFVATNAASYVANVDYFNFVESSEFEEETTTKYIEGGIEINGCQISTYTEGMRLVYSVEKEIEGKEVLSSGVVYSLIDYAISDDLIVDSQDYYVADFESSEEGRFEKTYSESDNAISYAMTMRFSHKTPSEFNAKWKARAFAKLSDGSYVYSDSVEYSFYSIADTLYRNNMMSTKEKHDYLYEVILSKANEGYEAKEYDFNSTYVN